uniref:Reverse transcriptase domain-containing protein n=1 Tax=Strongyloides venezuelensis TaxID=75913 RepID=A0A0K0FBB0_STRVS
MGDRRRRSKIMFSIVLKHIVDTADRLPTKASELNEMPYTNNQTPQRAVFDEYMKKLKVAKVEEHWNAVMNVHKIYSGTENARTIYNSHSQAVKDE